MSDFQNRFKDRITVVGKSGQRASFDAAGGSSSSSKHSTSRVAHTRTASTASSAGGGRTPSQSGSRARSRQHTATRQQPSISSQAALSTNEPTEAEAEMDQEREKDMERELDEEFAQQQQQEQEQEHVEELTNQLAEDDTLEQQPQQPMSTRSNVSGVGAVSFAPSAQNSRRQSQLQQQPEPEIEGEPTSLGDDSMLSPEEEAEQFHPNDATGAFDVQQLQDEGLLSDEEETIAQPAETSASQPPSSSRQHVTGPPPTVHAGEHDSLSLAEQQAREDAEDARYLAQLRVSQPDLHLNLDTSLTPSHHSLASSPQHASTVVSPSPRNPPSTLVSPSQPASERRTDRRSQAAAMTGAAIMNSGNTHHPSVASSSNSYPSPRGVGFQASPHTSSVTPSAQPTAAQPSSSRGPVASQTKAPSSSLKKQMIDPSIIRYNPTSSSLTPSVVPGGGSIKVHPDAAAYFGHPIAAPTATSPKPSPYSPSHHLQGHQSIAAGYRPPVPVAQYPPYLHYALPQHVPPMTTAATPQYPPPSTGQPHPTTTSQYPPSTGQYPPHTAQYPPHTAQYPPSTGQYPPYSAAPSYSYPYPHPSTAQYPPATAQYPSHANTHTTNAYGNYPQTADPYSSFSAQYSTQLHQRPQAYTSQPYHPQPYLQQQQQQYEQKVPEQSVSTTGGGVIKSAPGRRPGRPRQQQPATGSSPKASGTGAILPQTTGDARRLPPPNQGPHSPQRVRGPTQTAPPQPLIKGTGSGAGQAAVAKLVAAEGLNPEKRKRVEYKQYTLSEFKDLNLDLKLGGLGPDLDNEERKAKEAQNQRVKQLAERIREENALKHHETLTKPRPMKTREPVREPTAIEKAKEFAKNVPKPKVKRPNPEEEAAVQMVPQRIAGSSASTMVKRMKSPERGRGLIPESVSPSGKQLGSSASTSTLKKGKPTPQQQQEELQALMQKQAEQRRNVELMKKQMNL